VVFTARQHEPQPQCADPVAKTVVHYTGKLYYGKSSNFFSLL